MSDHHTHNPLEPDPETERRIRERAYHLWQQDGCPIGRDLEYWERARELQAIADSADAALIPNPATSPRGDEVIEEAAIQDNLGEFPGRTRDQGDVRQTPMTRSAEHELAAEES